MFVQFILNGETPLVFIEIVSTFLDWTCGASTADSEQANPTGLIKSAHNYLGDEILRSSGAILRLPS